MNKLFWFLIAAALYSHGYAHHKPMIEQQTPEPPPLVDAGPDAAVLKVHVIDAKTGSTVSATVSVNAGAQEPEEDPYRKFSLRRSGNRHKGPIRFRRIDYYFFTDGRFQVRVPPGLTTLEIRKGYEYQPHHVTLTALPRDTIDLKVSLERAIDMAEKGWYSGDTHIHMERTGINDDTLLTLISARDIRYAYLLSMNTGGYDRGGNYESWNQKKGLGDGSVARRGPYFITSGQEYRTSDLGHVTIIMPDGYVPGIGTTDDVDRGPSLSVIADQTRELRGFIGLAHGGYHRQEADGLLLADKMDFLELLQFGGYRSLGLDGWYDFLNLGFRLPIVGACDFPYTRELGSELTYAWSEKTPTPRTFAEALAAGRSFSTTGPMLFLEVDGSRPGQIINFPAGIDTTLEISISVVSPLYPVQYLELIVNGRAVKREHFDPLKPECEFIYNLPIKRSSWIAARTWAGAGTDAHTNPVYVYVDEKLPFSRDSARQIKARLEGSIETIPNEEVVRRLRSLKFELEKLLKGDESEISLPAARLSSASAPDARTGQNPDSLVIASLSIFPDKWNKAANARRIEKKIRQAHAQGAQLVITPEGALEGYVVNEVIRERDAAVKADLTMRFEKIAEPLDGEYIRRFRNLADELDIYLVLGFLESQGQKRYNSAALFGPEGELAGIYRKTHFWQGYDVNPPGYTPGDRYPLFDIGPLKLGLMICADRRFPEVARELALKGADLIACPAYGSWGEKNTRLLGTRAFENQVSLVFTHPEQSLMFNRDGDLLGQCDRDDILLGKVPAMHFDKTRASVIHRRPESYK